MSTDSAEEPENKQAKTEDGSDAAEDDGAESGDGGTGDGKDSEDKKPKRFPTMQEKKKANKPKKKSGPSCRKDNVCLLCLQVSYL